jgi:hypothetical protein
MNCFKRLGEKVMTRTFERLMAELNIRASIRNQFTELGTPQTVAVTCAPPTRLTYHPSLPQLRPGFVQQHLSRPIYQIPGLNILAAQKEEPVAHHQQPDQQRDQL